MTSSKLIGVRFPNYILSEVEKFGRENFPEKGDWNKTNTILHLIQKGLMSEGVTVIHNVKQGVNIEDLKKLIPSKQELLGEIREDLEVLIGERVKHEIAANIQPTLNNLNEYSRQHLEYISQLSTRIDQLESNALSRTTPQSKIPLEETETQKIKPVAENTVRKTYDDALILIQSLKEEGMTYRKIAEKLNNEGYEVNPKGKSQKWTLDIIRKFFSSQKNRAKNQK